MTASIELLTAESKKHGDDGTGKFVIIRNGNNEIELVANGAHIVPNGVLPLLVNCRLILNKSQKKKR